MAFKVIDPNVSMDAVHELLTWADANSDGSLQQDEFFNLAVELVRRGVIDTRNFLDFSPVRAGVVLFVCACVG